MDQSVNRSWKNWIIYGLVLCVSYLVYLGIANQLGGTYENPFAYFDKLAAAFLRGEMHIRSQIKADLTLYGSRWYVPFPPLPALLLMPYMWWMGKATVDTVMFSIVLSSFNVVVLYGMLMQLIRRGWTKISHGDVIWLTVLFALGTVHLYMTMQGSVWFLAQLATFTFATLSVWLALAKKHPILIGLALAIAMLARPHMALLGVLLLAIWGFEQREQVDQSREANDSWAYWLPALTKQAILIGIPLLIAVASLLWYNFARFEDPFDFGYTSQNVDTFLEDDLDTYGQFNLTFVPRNLKALLWALPEHNVDEGLPGLWPHRLGMSIFLTTPAFLFLLWPGKKSWLYYGALISLGLILIPLLTYYNTGWWQFGYRFSLDFMMILFLMLAHAAKGKLTWPFKLLVIISILINFWGMAWFAIITGVLA
ncbi:MAG: hypothetical protein AB8G95_08090 [Anaerolineae bacterium]